MGKAASCLQLTHKWWGEKYHKYRKRKERENDNTKVVNVYIWGNIRERYMENILWVFYNTSVMSSQQTNFDSGFFPISFKLK